MNEVQTRLKFDASINSLGIESIIQDVP